MHIKFINYIIDLLFPARCVVCKAQSAHYLCLEHRDTLTRSPTSYKNVHSTFSYADPHVKKLLNLLKYRHVGTIAEILGHHIGETILALLDEHETLSGFTDPLVVSIPSHKNTVRKRGYNQAALLARSAAVTAGLPYEQNVLIKNTKGSQVGHTRSERNANVHSSLFVLQKDKIDQRNIILVDDIVTTAATLHAGRDALLAAGARDVWMFSAAH